MRTSISSKLALTSAVVFATSAHAATILNACSTLNFGGGGSPVLSNGFLTASGCAAQCSGHQFAIVSYTNCWCSNSFVSSTVPISDCNTGCPGFGALEQCAGNGYYGYIALNSLATAAVSNADPLNAQFTAPPQSTSATSVSMVTSTMTSQVIVSTTPVPVAPTTTSSSSASSTSITPVEPVTTIETLTVSGAVVTSFITTIPSAAATRAPTATGASELPQPKASSGLSNGAVAGICVGSILGAAFLGALGFFFCCRRRGRGDGDEDAEQSSSMRRQASVLSRVGLLRGDSVRGQRRAAFRQQPPKLQTTGIGGLSGPASATTGRSGDLQMSESRTNRSAFTDNRLNPNALMNHQNTSRSSVGTLQDNQDYSRPLEVRNPDPS